jgi:hypothetical protein
VPDNQITVTVVTKQTFLDPISRFKEAKNEHECVLEALRLL